MDFLSASALDESAAPPYHQLRAIRTAADLLAKFRGLTVHIMVWLSIILLSGCGTLSYYSQAAGGQFDLIQGRRPIAQLIDDAQTPLPLRERLLRIKAIRRFAGEELALPVGNTYSGYIDLDRDYVLWNVLAAPANSLELKTWCYPVVGCQSYRGYFDQRQARRLAADLGRAGWDTWAPGVIAYSSLGWFDDPVLSTFSDWPEDRLAALIFHELSHKAIYINGDTTFNESYATAVELEGLLRYLSLKSQPEAFTEALGRQRMEREFAEMVMATAEALRELYSRQALPEATMLERKAALMMQLRAVYRERRQHWPQPNAYAHFFGPGLNNARIASVGTYNRWVSAFRQLLHEENGNFESFHEAVRALSILPRKEREEQLTALEARIEVGHSSSSSEKWTNR